MVKNKKIEYNLWESSGLFALVQLPKGIFSKEETQLTIQ
jgi:hypothetical protein